MAYDTANANATTSIFNYLSNSNPTIGITLLGVTNNSSQNVSSLAVSTVGLFNDASFTPTITYTLLKDDAFAVAAASGSGSSSSEAAEVWIG